VTGPVVVTGAAGKLGGAVVAHLIASGIPVVAVDRRPAPGVVHTMPIDAPEPLRPIVRGARAVIHLAAMPNPRAGPGHTIFITNTAATYAVLEAAAQEGVPRVVTASSGSVLGVAWGPRELSPKYVPLDEQHPVQPQDGYALSKQADEATCAMFHRSTGISVAALRFPAVRTHSELGPLTRQVAEDPGAGRRGLWSYVEVEDLARAFAAAVIADGIGFEVFCIAAADTTSEVPTEDLLRRYHPETIVLSPVPGTASVWDTTKARRLLDWTSTTTWRD
jgi:nucleoside-diphosphate-sugar epimerase